MNEKELNSCVDDFEKHACKQIYDMKAGVKAAVEGAVLKHVLEIDSLKRLIFDMTHHEGSLEETKGRWIKVIASALGIENETK